MKPSTVLEQELRILVREIAHLEQELHPPLTADQRSERAFWRGVLGVVLFLLCIFGGLASQ